jgi:hypothetical protein
MVLPRRRSVVAQPEALSRTPSGVANARAYAPGGSYERRSQDDERSRSSGFGYAARRVAECAWKRGSYRQVSMTFSLRQRGHTRRNVRTFVTWS